MRRKAPCTRKEIWMIQKYLSEEILSEPLLTGKHLVQMITYLDPTLPNTVPFHPSLKIVLAVIFDLLLSLSILFLWAVKCSCRLT